MFLQRHVYLWASRDDDFFALVDAELAQVRAKANDVPANMRKIAVHAFVHSLASRTRDSLPRSMLTGYMENDMTIFGKASAEHVWASGISEDQERMRELVPGDNDDATFAPHIAPGLGAPAGSGSGSGRGAPDADPPTA
jgi:hypothetical protein